MTARFPTFAAIAAVALLSAGCGSPGGPSTASTAGLPAAASHSTRWIPAPGTTFQIQYGGKLDTSVDADVYDVDWQDTSQSTVDALHAKGRKVMCYVSVGTWENWRPDASTFPKSVIGKPDGGWKGERWLDVRQTAILEPIMTARFQVCKSKHFDGLDPDNMDGFENNTGFSNPKITYAQQLAYNTWVANEAHALGLTVDEKGDNDQVKDMAKVFDFAVTEECWKQGWCDTFSVYTARNALVIDVEYNMPPATFTSKACADVAKYNEDAILKHLNLNAWIVTCPKGG